MRNSRVESSARRRRAAVSQVLMLCVAAGSLCLSVFARATSVSATSLSAFAPGETLLYLQVRDLTQLREAWLKTPYFRLWTDSRFALFFQPAKKRLADARGEMEKEAGIALDELRSLLPGEAAVFLSDLRYRYNESTKQLYKESNSGFIARIAGDPERVRRLVEDRVLKDVPAGAQRSSEEFMGARIFTTTYKTRLSAPIPDRTGAKGGAPQPSESGLALPDASNEANLEYHYEYAFVGDCFLLLEGQRAFAKKVVANYFAAKKGRSAPGSLGATEGFREVSRALGPRPDVLAYANTDRLLRQTAGNPAAGFAQFAKKAKSLRIDELRAAGIAVRLTAKATELDAAVLTTSSPQGVARLIVNRGKNAFRSRELAPRNATSYSCFYLDLADVYRLLRETVAQTSERGGQALDATLAQLSKAAQTDVGALISRLGGEVATFSWPANESPGQAGGKTTEVTLVQLKQEEGFAESAARLLSAFGGPGPAGPASSQPVDRTQFKGFTIYSLPQSKPGQGGGGLRPGLPVPTLSGLSFAVAKSFLILSGSPQGVKDTLGRMAGESDGGVARNDDFRGATGALKPGYSGFSWADLGKWTAQTVRTVQSQPLLLFGIGQFVQTTQMPPPEAFSRYFGQMASAAYSSDDTFRYHALILYPK